MYTRMLKPPEGSFFLFGPRGVGKTAWLRSRLPDALYFDLLHHETWTDLLASPARLDERIPKNHQGWVVLDEIQRLPLLLNEVHRLIESRRLRFAISGSSARKLRRRGVNLLAGRAVTRAMHPLTARELGADFDLKKAVQFGGLPRACTDAVPRDYLKSYVATWLTEEIREEGLARNLGNFARFLEAASFSQGAVLNIASVARDCSVHVKAVQDYFAVLEDLLVAVRLPVFTRRAKRSVARHPKFYFFDAGVFQAIRPRGPLDAPEEVRGPALESLFLHNLRAHNDYRDLGYSLHFWRTPQGREVDFVLYGERGLRAFEVKVSERVRSDDTLGLREFLQDYPMAKASLLHLGSRRWHERGIDVVPIVDVLGDLEKWL
ncbi:MAG: ATP-binding protein [Planctomycetes bacterium]|nr:ATP-binding protein [Planctomycetota bacterium]